MCKAEDIDEMVAQAIAMEDSKHVTTRDHLYGIDSHILSEGEHANTVKGSRTQSNTAIPMRTLRGSFETHYNFNFLTFTEVTIY